jgi:hypothetical protein
LARASECDYVNRRDFAAVNLRYIPQVQHIGELFLCYGNGMGNNFTRPYGLYSFKLCGVGKTADAIE